MAKIVYRIPKEDRRTWDVQIALCLRLMYLLDTEPNSQNFTSKVDQYIDTMPVSFTCVEDSLTINSLISPNGYYYVSHLIEMSDKI